MTPVQTQPHPMNSPSASRSVVEAMDEAGPQVWGHMTVEVALSVMASARAGHLVLCDEDGRCTGRVTQAQLTTVRGSSSYTDRIRLRDVLGVHGPGTSPATTTAGAEQAGCNGRFGTLPVVGGQGCTTGAP